MTRLVVPDAIHHTDTSEPLMYIQGWNDCRQAMLAEQALDKMAENARELGLDYEPAPMFQPNRVISYAAAMKLRELGYEWMNDEWKHLDELAGQPVPVPWSQALEAVWAEEDDPIGDAQDRLIAEQAAQKRPQNCGTGYCSCIKCVMEPSQQEPLGIVKDLFTNAAWDKLDVVGSTKVYLDFPPAQQEPLAWGIIASNTGRLCQVELDAGEVEGHNPKHIVPLCRCSQAPKENQS